MDLHRIKLCMLGELLLRLVRVSLVAERCLLRL